jgi:chromate transporter
MILAIALFFTQIKDNERVVSIFKGLRPAVVALIVAPCLTLAKSVGITWRTSLVALAAAVLIWQLNVSPVYVILAAAAGGMAYGLRIKKD